MIPHFERWSACKFYISFTSTTQNQSQIPRYHLGTNTTRTIPEATLAQFILQKSPLHKRPHHLSCIKREEIVATQGNSIWEMCAETISCLVDPRSQAQLLKMVTDLHGSSICVSTDHTPALFAASDKSLYILKASCSPSTPSHRNGCSSSNSGFTNTLEQDKRIFVAGFEVLFGWWGWVFLSIIRAQPPRV